MHHRIFITGAIALLVIAAPAFAQYGERRTTPEEAKAQMQYRAGWELMRSEAFEEAAARFKLAIELDPKLALAYYGLGRADMALKRYVEAIRAYTTCRDLYIARTGQKFIAQVDANRAREDELMDLRELQRQNSNGPQTQATANNQRLIQNRIRMVEQNLDKGRNLDIDMAVPAFISLALGSAYFRGQHFEDAEREYKAAIQADKSVGEAHNNLAVVYMLTGRLEDAEKEVKLAERAGFDVSRDFKRELSDRRKP
jgi:tetratricopeptide (TPR) repeat protein